MLVYIRARAVFTVTHTMQKNFVESNRVFLIVCSINFDKDHVTAVS